MGAKSGQRKKSGGLNRPALIIFGVLFVALFAGVGIAVGIGSTSVPSGDVAVVASVPDGHVSEAQFKRGYAQQLGQSSGKKAPKAGSKKDDELREAALREILESIWIKGEAEELNLSVTPKEIETELAQIKKTNFPTEKSFQEFLKSSHFSEQDVNDRVELQLISKKVQTAVTNEATPPSKSEIADYYNASKATQYTVKPTRDIRLIVNKDKGEAEKAKEALEKDNSPANWKKVATKYSEDETTKKTGGLQKEISEEVLPPNLKAPIFKSATGEIKGPLSFQKKYLVIEVANINAEKVKSLKEVESEISAQLTQQVQQEHFTEFISGYQQKWRERTTCASDHLIELCSNFKGTGHPSTAPAACYEANPKTPAKECPAPVEQIKPALPGTTTLLKPQGERLVQRPIPLASKKAKAKAAVEEAAGAAGASPEGSASPETGAGE